MIRWQHTDYGTRVEVYISYRWSNWRYGVSYRNGRNVTSRRRYRQHAKSIRMLHQRFAEGKKPRVVNRRPKLANRNRL